MISQRTKDILTCGITNIPLTKPARVYFVNYDKTNFEYENQVYALFESMKIEFERSDNHYNNSSQFTSINEIDTRRIKMIFRNFRTLRPKLLTQWRYLFWEIDTLSIDIFWHVLKIYESLKLPVYWHRSMNGYHFLCVKPIKEQVWQEAINQLRPTNHKYPPITLRINPNKYKNEESIFYDGGITSTLHRDTLILKKLIESKDWIKIGMQYQIVWYNPDNNDFTNKMSLQEREQAFLKQIEDSK